jgi:thymidine kinase
MFSGKTSELIRRIRRYNVAKKKCLIIKYKKDTRYSEECAATHDKQTETAKACEKLSEVLPIVDQFDVIGIDEGQFFADIVSFTESRACLGKIVIVAGLDGTFQRRPFGSLLDLIPLAEEVTKLNAICMLCSKDAAFTKRISNETDIELIGGSEKYISVCRVCFHAAPNDVGNKN